LKPIPFFSYTKNPTLEHPLVCGDFLKKSPLSKNTPFLKGFFVQFFQLKSTSLKKSMKTNCLLPALKIGKNLWIVLLAFHSQGNCQPVHFVPQSPSPFKKSYLFVDLGLGGILARSKPYIQIRNSVSGVGQIAPQSRVPLVGYPGIAKSFGGFVGSVGVGGDYIFKSSCFVLGGYLKYAIADVSQKFFVTHVRDFRAGKSNFATSEAGLKLRLKGYLSVGARLGVRCNRHLFVGLVGMSFPSFSGSIWSIKQGVFSKNAIPYKSRIHTFFQLGGEYSYAISNSFSMALSCILNMGHVRLNKIRASKFTSPAEAEGLIGCQSSWQTITDTTTQILLNKIKSAKTVFRSKSNNFLEFMGIFRYTLKSDIPVLWDRSGSSESITGASLRYFQPSCC
jgi:hypothetical protein